MHHDEQFVHSQEAAECLATFVLDAERHVSVCNEKFSRLTGLRVGDTLPRRAEENGLSPLLSAILTALENPSNSVSLERSYEANESERIAAVDFYRASDGTGVGAILDRPAPPGVERALVAKNRQYHEVLDHLRAGIVIHGPTTRIRYANERAACLLGWGPDRLIGAENSDSRWEFFHEDGSPMPVDEYPAARALFKREVVEGQVVGLRRPNDQQLVWVMCNADPVPTPDGKILEAVVSFTDITRRKLAEEELRRSEERLRLVLEGSNDAPWDIDLRTGARYVSPRWWAMLGREVGEAPRSTEPWTEYFHPEDAARALETFRKVRDDQEATTFQIEIRLLHAYGHYVPALARGIIVRASDGSALRLSGTTTDLTDRKRTEQQAYQLAFFDQLTDLPNRQLLIQQLQKSILQSSRSGRNGAVLLVDLDDFTFVNDTLGHDTGDALLKEVAHRLTGCVRAADTVGRLGGDEFVIVLDHLSERVKDAAVEAEQMAEKIFSCLRHPFTLGGASLDVTAGIGITLFDGDHPNVETVLRQVDLAMFEAKSMGPSNLRFFDLKMQTAVDARLDIERELRKSVHSEQLQLYYQLQVSVEGRVLGAETLLRWIHPERGMIIPDAFIPIAEASALIIPIGLWVIRTACIQIKQWSGHPVLGRLSLSVNVSVRQFNEEEFVDQVLHAVKNSGADPRKLKLEITESLLAKDIEAIIAKMNRLKEVGIGFSLDDFGTGYSSLYYLQQLPLNELKIDRKFVQEVLANPQHRAIARIIITLAETLELTVTAEGVETEGQRQFLEASGCDAFQGYLFGAPTPLEHFEAEALRRNGPQN